MSIRMERRLRKKYKNEDTPSTFSKSLSNNINTCSHTLLSSSSSSSPHISDIATETKVRRKKIRSTQDFNHLVSSSLSSVDFDESAKPKSKKTKKNKILFSLPKIAQVAEDTSAKHEDTCDTNYGELIPKKRGRKKNRKQNSHSQEGEKDIETTLISKQCIGKTKITEECKSANSTSDSGRDSEVEIITKNKRLRNKKKSTSGNINVEAPEVQRSGFEGYAKRIEKLLNDEPIRKTRSSYTSNSLASTPVSGRKLKQGSTNKKISIRSIEQETPKANADKQNTTSKKSISFRMSRQSTPHPKIKLRFSSHETFNEQPVLRNSKPSLPENCSSRYLSFDIDFQSDDVFENTTQSQPGDVKNNNFDQQETVNNLSNVNKIRKSVRFKSPEENIRRETLIISKPILQNISKELLIEERNHDLPQISDTGASSSGSTKRNSTFEVISPKIMNSRTSNFGTSEDADCMDDNILEKHSPVNLSKQTMNSSVKRKSCSLELFSPQRKSLRKSVSDNDVSLWNTSNIKTDENEKYSQPASSRLPSASSSKLIRSATFTMDDETIKQTSDLTPGLKYSSPLHTSYSKPIDTSKVNKRRRWDKSRLSVSFLDNSLDIGNISAPWLGDESNKSFNVSINKSEHNLDIKCSPTINNASINNISIKNRGTPPSASSTPFLKGKTNLLRQAVLKGKQDITINENKKVNGNPGPCKIVRTKVPNFALIHQRALDKMENIKEMSERKAARAKLLLSGHKPPNGSISKSSSNRKELKFSPTHLKSTPLNESINKILNKTNVSITKINKVSPSKSNPKATNKENRKTPIEIRKEHLKMKSQIPVKSKVPHTVIAEKKGFTRFGFKQRTEGVKLPTKDEQVKAVAQKTKVMKNALDERRTIIQGVRSNRRFELLMQKRNK